MATARFKKLRDRLKPNKPVRDPDHPTKEMVVLAKQGDKEKLVRFGDKKLSLKSHIPERKKSYCARSEGQGNLTNKLSANYWSRKRWKC